MATRDYFSHNIPPTGEEVFAVLDQKGYCYNVAGENIGWNNYPDDQATAVVQNNFMNSPGHRGNIMGTTWDVAGIGAYKLADGRKFYTVLFADRTGCGSTPTATPKPDAEAHAEAHAHAGPSLRPRPRTRRSSPPPRRGRRLAPYRPRTRRPSRRPRQSPLPPRPPAGRDAVDRALGDAGPVAAADRRANGDPDPDRDPVAIAGRDRARGAHRCRAAARRCLPPGELRRARARPRRRTARQPPRADLRLLSRVRRRRVGGPRGSGTLRAMLTDSGRAPAGS